MSFLCLSLAHSVDTHFNSLHRELTFEWQTAGLGHQGMWFIWLTLEKPLVMSIFNLAPALVPTSHVPTWQRKEKRLEKKIERLKIECLIDRMQSIQQPSALLASSAEWELVLRLAAVRGRHRCTTGLWLQSTGGLLEERGNGKGIRERWDPDGRTVDYFFLTGKCIWWVNERSRWEKWEEDNTERMIYKTGREYSIINREYSYLW